MQKSNSNIFGNFVDNLYCIKQLSFKQHMKGSFQYTCLKCSMFFVCIQCMLLSTVLSATCITAHVY